METLEIETRTTWHDQSTVLSPKQLLDIQTQQRARYRFKIKFIMMMEDVKENISNFLKEI